MQLQWHTIVVIYYSFILTQMYLYLFFFSCLPLLYYQVAQLAYVVEDRLKEATEDADRERALKDVVVATVKDKGKAVEATEKRAQASENA